MSSLINKVHYPFAALIFCLLLSACATTASREAETAPKAPSEKTEKEETGEPGRIPSEEKEEAVAEAEPEVEIPPFPIEPERVSPVNGVTTVETTPALEWSFSEEYAKTRIQIAEVEEFSESLLIDEEISASTRFQVTESLMEGGIYSWRIKVKDDRGVWSEWSQPYTFLVDPEAEANLLFLNDDDVVPSLTPRFEINRFHGAYAYNIQLAADEEFSENSLIADTTVEEPFFRFEEQLSEDIGYFIRARYQNRTENWSDWTLPVGFTVKEVDVEMVEIIPPGETAVFEMGSDSGRLDETPPHSVTLNRSFRMGRYPITNEEFCFVINWAVRRNYAVIDEGDVYDPDRSRILFGLQTMNYGEQFGVTLKGDIITPIEGRENHPVIGVSWYGAILWCNWYSELRGLETVIDGANLECNFEGEGYRLPTEAEWEYAAVGTNQSELPWGDTFSGRDVNFFDSGDSFESTLKPFTQKGGPTTPVGFLSGTSPFSLYDIVGNIWEWCWDYYDEAYYSESPPEDPRGAKESEYRSVRGCAWNTRRLDVSVRNRGRYKPEGKSYSLGFRIAQSIAAPVADEVSEPPATPAPEE